MASAHRPRGGVVTGEPGLAIVESQHSTPLTPTLHARDTPWLVHEWQALLCSATKEEVAQEAAAAMMADTNWRGNPDVATPIAATRAN